MEPKSNLDFVVVSRRQDMVRSVISSWAERAARSAAGPAPRSCAMVTGRYGL
jgi:hypothetical protein